MALNAEFGQTFLNQFPYLQEVACLSTDSVNDLVCMRGLPSLEKWRVQKADPSDYSKMPVVGVLLLKTTPTVGIIQVNGPLLGVFSGLQYDRPCFVGSSGIVQTPPSPGGAGQVMFVQEIAFATDVDAVFLTGNISMTQRTW